MPTNYVEVLVKSKDQAKPDLDELKTKLNDLAGRVAEARAMVDDADAAAKLDKMRAQLLALDKRTANPKISMQGAVSAEAQLHALEASLAKVDAKTKQTARTAAAAGDKAGKGFVSRFAAWLKPSRFQLVTAGLSSALAALPALGALAGTGIAFGLGAKIAAGIPAVKKQLKSLGASLTQTLDTAIKPMLPAITAVVGQIGTFVKAIGPQLADLFKAAAPALMPLAKGLEGLISGLLPGLLSLVKAAQPAISVFAGLLGDLGRNLGAMLSALAPAVSASAGILSALGKVLDAVLPIVGQLAASFATTLAPVLTAVGQAVTALTPAIQPLAQILASLAGAVLTSVAGGLEAIAQLVQALAPSFGVLAKVAGQVFTAMENSGVFGVLENALESLVGPLGKLISALITGFAPVLGQLLSLVGQVAASLGTDLVHAASALLPLITSLVPLIAQIATALLQVLEQAIVPLLPQISQLMQILVTFLVQALTPILPAVAQLALALVKILMAVTPLLPPLLRLITLGVELLMKVVLPLRGPIVVLVKALTGLADIVAVVVGWVVKFAAAAIGWITHLGNIKKAAADVLHWISGHWAALLFGLLTTPFTKALPAIGHVLGSILTGAKDDLGKVVSFLSGLPGQFVSALSSLYSDMVHVGGQVISGIWDGIKGAAGGLKDDIGGFVGDVTGWFTSGFGIFSPSRVMSERVGKYLPPGIAEGIHRNLEPLRAAARRATQVAVAGAQSGMAGIGAGSYGAAGGAGAPQHLILEVTGADAEFVRLIRKIVKAKGGAGPHSVQKAFGQVATS